jgi:hypothetical protein
MRLVIASAALFFTACSCGYEAHTLDGASSDGGACPAPITPDVPAACAALPDLASLANAVTLRPGGGTAFALSGVAPNIDPADETCEDGYWEDHRSARLRFTAPTGGRWRFTVRGDGITLLSLAPCDAAPRCTGDLGIRGEHLSSSTVRDVDMQRGDSFALGIDGCAAGVACGYDLSVERIADLSCPGLYADSPCGAGAYCTIDPCDAERFACRTIPTPQLTRIQVLAGDTTGYVVGVADDGGAGRGGYLLVRWLDAS